MGVCDGSELLDHLLKSAASHQFNKKVGVEIEQFGVFESQIPLQYHSKNKKIPGVDEILKLLVAETKANLIENHEGLALGISLPDGKVTLEPGSQLEYATSPKQDLKTLFSAINSFEGVLQKISDPLHVDWFSMGAHPFLKVNDVSIIPSPRYAIMTEYLRSKGSLSLHMMRLTTSLQINLDYQDEKDAIQMLQTALLASPFSYALFATSPFLEGKKTNWLSTRFHIWQNTDKDRTGLLPFVFSSHFDLSEYAKWIWKMPLMFAQNNQAEYVAAKGASLCDIYKGKLPQVEPCISNQLSGLRQLFSETRIKPGYIEIRSLDGLDSPYREAAIAFWKGLLFSKEAKDFVQKTIDPKDLELLTETSSKLGLNTYYRSTILTSYLNELLPMIEKELQHEAFYLNPIYELIESKVNLAQRWLQTTKNVESWISNPSRKRL